MPDRKRILIIDDEKGFTAMLQLNLESWGPYEVLVENDPRNAFSAAMEFKPNVILLDVIMPHLEGPDLAIQFKEEPHLSKIPIIFLTATITPQEVEENNGLIGGHPFISKPSEIESIIEVIELHSPRIP